MAELSYTLPLDNIQGNILAGFHKDFESHLFLEFTTQQEARIWLNSIVNEIATSEEVKQFNDLFKTLRKRSGREGTVKATWTNIAFTHSGLEALGVLGNELESFPEAFKLGMKERAEIIGDSAISSPDHWIKPLGSKNIHALLMVASDSQVDLHEAVMRYTHDLYAYPSINIVFVQEGKSRQDQPGHEHFGFKDGVSQPGVRGFTKPNNPDNENQGNPGQDLLHAGEFIVGYPTQLPFAKEGHDGPNPDEGEVSQSGPTWTKDGSYLVFRRLQQNVPAFKNFVKETAKKLGVSEELMGAKMVGRYRSGAPLERTEDQPKDFDPTLKDPSIDDPSILKDDKINHFEFGEDEEGKIVPRAAHIRKTYPRDQGGNDTESHTQTRRMLRRGITYGNSYRPQTGIFSKEGEARYPYDRGLLFLAYQSDIERQFEFVQQFWVNNAQFPQSGDGEDPIIAQSKEGPFSLPVCKPSLTAASGCPVQNVSIKHFVTTTGGEYFFQPSISALKMLAGE
jgi:Dyp-type peroxidase family